MGMYKKIVLAVDGSEASKIAVKHGIELTKQTNGVLIAIHVIPPIGSTDIETFKPGAIKHELVTGGEKILAEIEEIARKQGVEIKTSVEEGVPFEKICEVAEESDADLIIMGSHGRTGIGKVLIGSVTEQ